jgi:hypothetical protein
MKEAITHADGQRKKRGMDVIGKREKGCDDMVQ